MGKHGQRVKSLVPPGRAPSKSAKPVTSLKLARKLTSKFHSLLAQQASVESATGTAPEAKKTQLKDIEDEIAQMGGREAYQEASALATKNFKSSRYVYKTLTRYGLQPKKGELPLRVLEVGAVNAQLVVSPWLRTRAIDLLSRHPKVEQKDFYAVPVGSGPTPPSSSLIPPPTQPTSSTSTTTTTNLTKDSLQPPTTSRLHEVDWDAWVEKDKIRREELRIANMTGQKRARSDDNDDDEEEDDEEEEEEKDDGEGGDGSSSSAKKQSRDSTKSNSDSAQQQISSKVHVSPYAFRTHIAAPSKGYPTPITGGYDVVVNAMVINCVMDPIQRAEMLVRCRDHLVPGGLLYLALPSRCIDMSSFFSRKMLEQLLSIIGFIKVDEKLTPKISFFLLRRADVTPIYGSGTTATTTKVKPSLTVTGYGNAWKPIIVAQTPQDEALLTRLANNPPRTLPHAEMPRTGFSRTDFALSVPSSWVLRSDTFASTSSSSSGNNTSNTSVSAVASSGAAASTSTTSTTTTTTSPKFQKFGSNTHHHNNSSSNNNTKHNNSNSNNTNKGAAVGAGQSSGSQTKANVGISATKASKSSTTTTTTPTTHQPYYKKHKSKHK